MSVWRRLSAAVVAGVALSITAGCGGGDVGACAPPVPASAAELALLPAGLSLDRVGAVTRVVSTQGHVTVQAVADQPIDELTVLIQDAVTAAGYRPAGMDNEGFEAEVFFTSGSYAAGQAIVRRATTCDGRWDVELVLVDPAIVAPATATP